MAIDVLLPQWGMGMTEGTVLEWLCAEGDPVGEGDELVEIETAKAVRAVTAPASGVLAEILAAPDTVVPVGCVLALMLVSETR